ncbi:uncharacterized protein LOC124939164 [Impatiens glandulifera]|uniref:uncharacterized protein LOC124939164 n=1 Tax=Impatiens glandulifera TaxID=253017 RepID=UPI001FB1293B|nr:uncharacterized protein LOC124939164 [Impatiens glandulifera]
MGNFNVTKFIQERDPETGITLDMLVYNECIRDINCIEPSNSSNLFSWSATRGLEEMRKSRIDRGLINEKWQISTQEARYNDISKRVEEARVKLENIQRKSLRMQNLPNNQAEEKEALTSFRDLYSKEESFSSRSLEKGQEVVQKKAITYYKGLIGTKISNEGLDARLRVLQQIVLRRIANEDANKMVKRVSQEEIKNTLFTMKGGKSPGPDGYNANFFKENWDIVGKDCVSTPHFIVSMNGIRSGFFKGERGVKQGDPFSPYLFVLIMDILDFHADVESVNTIKEALTMFSSITGLFINEYKSHAFYGGRMKENLKHNIFNIMRIKEGTLPVKYLGVPLSANQLQSSHFRPLIEKVRNSILGWATKNLSYAGRIELVKRVTMGIIGY